MFKTNMLIVGLLVSSLIGNVLLFLSIATIKRDLGALSSVLKYAKRRKLRKDNPALERLEDIVERRDPIVLPDPKDVELVISLAPGLMANLIRAAWVTGCRQAELVNVPRSNLDHKRKELTVIGKGNKLRVIDLVPFKGDKYLSKVPAHLRSKYLFWHSDCERFKNVHGHFARLVTKIAARNQDFRKFRPASYEVSTPTPQAPAPQAPKPVTNSDLLINSILNGPSNYVPVQGKFVAGDADHCPSGYAWDSQNKACRLESSFRAVCVGPGC
jgi:hypothetical protein